MPHGHLDVPASGVSLVDKPAAMTRAEFDDRMKRIHVSTERAENLDPITQIELALQFLSVRDSTAPIPSALAEGIESALHDLETKAPGIREALSQVPIIPADLDIGIAGITISRGNTTRVALTTQPENFAALRTQIKSDPSTAVATRVLATVDDADIDRESIRLTLIHEAVHVADRQLDGALTRELVDAVMREMPQDQIPAFMAKNVSQYAERGGANEAAAEVFTAAMAGLPLPPLLQRVADGYMQRSAQP
jgi:hypothetical protein